MAKCPVCETTVNDNQFIEKYISPFNNQEYKLYHCPNCDLQWWEPLKMVPEFYEHEGSEMYKAFHSGIRTLLEEHHKLFFKLFPIKKGKLLDIGCGDCLFLFHAKNLGFEVWGIDFDKKSVKICKEIRNMKNIYSYTPEEFLKNVVSTKSIKFDIITFFEVLEHQDDPIYFLNTIKKMLKPNGWIAGSVPNRNSWLQKKLYQQIFDEIDHPPHHFLRFSKKSLFFLLKKSGFSNIRIEKTPPNLEAISSALTYILLGKKKISKIKLSTLGDTKAGEYTLLYLQAALIRKLLFKTLKKIRNFVLLPSIIFIKPFLSGNHLYFQAKVGD